MSLTIQKIGLILGAVLAIVYTCIVFYKKNKPDLPQIITIIMASVGLMTGIFLGYTAIIYDDIALGELSEHRLPVFVGGIAILYISVDGIVRCFRKATDRQ